MFRNQILIFFTEDNYVVLVCVPKLERATRTMYNTYLHE